MKTASSHTSRTTPNAGHLHVVEPALAQLASWAPEQASEAYAWTYQHLLSPAWQKVMHGRTTFDHLGHVERSQWFAREAIEAEQLSALKALLLHAGTNVPYYRELFARVGFDPRGVTSPGDLAELPLLTREIIHERYEDLLDPAHRGATIKKGTSGTTGRPLQFEYCNGSESWRQALRLRGYGWAGYKMGLPTLHYWAQGAVVPKGLGAAKVKLDRALRREVYVDAMAQDEASLREAVDTLRRTRPHIVIGYTQATALFARFIIDQGLRDWDDIPVICGAEGVLPLDRAALSRAFGPGVFETYGSRETMLIGAECQAHDGMHLSEENLVVEVTRAGHRVEEGESGDIVLTDLHNYAMPFIRYLNGDVGAMAPERACPCGRLLRKLERVDGRRCDTLLDPAGEPIPGMLFVALFADARDVVKEFQVVQRRATGEVTLRVVPGSEWDPAAFDETVRRFRSYLRGQTLHVEYADRIPPGKSGKRRRVVVEDEQESRAA